MTDAKLKELSRLVENVKMDDGQLSRTYIKGIEGIQRYYLSVLPSSYREVFRTMMDDVCERWKRTDKDISQKTMNQIRNLILGEDKTPMPLHLWHTRHRPQWNIGNTCATFLRTVEWNSIAE